jgi:hypothetical protein
VSQGVKCIVFYCPYFGFVFTTIDLTKTTRCNIHVELDPLPPIARSDIAQYAVRVVLKM